ncbi:MAG: hypothetical protein KBA03_03650 [Anaerolineaceae bacterium]|nr:hypothetical protein [Anaerolineaceae bacterium]
MAVRQALIERVLVESALEMGQVERIQAFAASMAYSVEQLVKANRLSQYQVAILLGRYPGSILGTQKRHKLAEIIVRRLKLALIAEANPDSALARARRSKDQLGLF